MDLLGGVSQESRNEKPPHRVGLFQPEGGKTTPLLLARMRPPLIQDGQTGQRDRGLKSANFRILPAGGLQAKVTEDSPSIAEMFTHIHFVRLVFVFEDAPGVASQKQLPETEWVLELDSDRIAGMPVEANRQAMISPRRTFFRNLIGGQPTADYEISEWKNP